MIRYYSIRLTIEAPDDTDIDALDDAVEKIVENSTAREAIATGLAFWRDHDNGPVPEVDSFYLDEPTTVGRF